MKGLLNTTRLNLLLLHKLTAADRLTALQRGKGFYTKDQLCIETSLPFTLKGLHLPVNIVVAIKVSKLEIQNFGHVGTFLAESVFAQG
jgi:hypothetical protein